MSVINDYYAALERLKTNKPTVLPKGSVINNDTIALKAGQNVLSPTQRIELAKTKTKAVKSDYEQLKEDYEKLLEKCNALLLEYFELIQKTHL